MGEADAHRDAILGLPMSLLSGFRFRAGDAVRKTKGSSWHGRVVGFYSTHLTPIGYAVESGREPGSVRIYPEVALEPDPDAEGDPHARRP